MKTPEVWVCIPTAQRDHVREQLKKWRGAGYKVAVLIDFENKTRRAIFEEDYDMLVACAKYPGIWSSWNVLAKAVVAAGADVCVLAGDDMDPDPSLTAQQIAGQYLERFPTGFGVMQPCGDMQGDLIDGWRNAGRICGSPWVGRLWVQHAYEGNGPVCAEYNSFYADEELLNVAGNFGVLWRREDLQQRHLHWSWGHLPKQEYHDRNQQHWAADNRLFDERRKKMPYLSGRHDKLGWYMKKEEVKA